MALTANQEAVLLSLVEFGDAQLDRFRLEAEQAHEQAAYEAALLANEQDANTKTQACEDIEALADPTDKQLREYQRAGVSLKRLAQQRDAIVRIHDINVGRLAAAIRQSESVIASTVDARDLPDYLQVLEAY